MLGLGFGFVEVGTVTPQPQSGNPKPRLFRLAEDQAVINRLGFNNRGQDAAAMRLALRDPARGVVGINVGANTDSIDRVADYAVGVKAMAPLADYLTINISSPNTPGLRDLQAGGELVELLTAVGEARTNGVPVFLKVAPDLENGNHERIVRAAIDGGIDALIVANTTVSRPALQSRFAGEAGGLSGAPLGALALNQLRHFRSASGGQLPLIAAGGIASAEDAWSRILAGASLVQLYTALVYHGPGLARRIADGLAAILEREGIANIADAVGSERH
jgi:dihydroorotate dehydrogenase